MSGWIDLSSPVPIGHVIGAAALSGWSPQRAAERLRELGAVLPDTQWSEIALTPEDQHLLSRDLGSRGPWLSLRDPVKCMQLLPGLNRTGYSVGHALARLHRFGASFPTDLEIVPEDLLEED